MSARTPGAGRRVFGGGPGACRLRGQESEVDGMDLLGEMVASTSFPMAESLRAVSSPFLFLRSALAEEEYVPTLLLDSNVGTFYTEERRR